MNFQLSALRGFLLPAAEKLPFSDVVAITFTGITVVFLGLIILIIFITLMGKIFEAINKKGNGKKTPPAEKPVITPAPAPVQTTQQPLSDSDDDEIIAAITAAVAMMSAQDGTTYKVKSIRQSRPSGGARPAWAMAGLRDNTTPF